MKIYSFKETDIEKYQHWNGFVPYDHPTVWEFINGTIQIIKDNNLESQYPDFITNFNIAFNDEILNNSKFLE